jgi:hypothetical protein
MFWRKQKKGTVWITPYISMRNSELNESENKTVKAIADKLSMYEDKMVSYGNVKDKHIQRLQQIEANWDIDNSTISLFAHGSGCFSWEGTLQDFLNNKFDMLECA